MGGCSDSVYALIAGPWPNAFAAACAFAVPSEVFPEERSSRWGWRRHSPGRDQNRSSILNVAWRVR